MARTKTWTYLLAATLFLGLGGGAEAKPKKTKRRPAKTAVVAPIKKAPAVSPEHKKALASLHGVYKLGMTKEEVIAALTAQLDERYAEIIEKSTNVGFQDQKRKEKKQEVDRLKQSFVSFEGKKTGWDVSLVEDEFAHNTDESMLVYWETDGGKNQRRFFFFYQGKLYKMFLSLDTSQMAADSRNFESFRKTMESNFGPGLVEPGRLTWEAGDFHVAALDRLRQYDALCLVIWDPTVMTSLAALRAERAPKKAPQDNVMKQVLDGGGKEPSLDENKGAIDDLIKRQ
jgi:hypothetical protein